MNQFKTRAGDASCVFVVFLHIYKYTPNTIITRLWWLHRKEVNNMKHLPSPDSWCHLKVSGNHNQVFMSPREQNNLNASNKSLLAYCSTPRPLSLIVSCLLGSQTCWWPLKSVTLCVCGCACVWVCLRMWWCVAAYAAVCGFVCGCVITSVSSCSMSSLYVLSSYHIFSCSSHWLPVYGLKSGVLFRRLSAHRALLLSIPRLFSLSLSFTF